MSEEDKKTSSKSSPPAAKAAAKPAAASKSGGAYMLPDSNPWAGAWKIAAGIGAVGLVASGAGMASGPEGAHRFAFSYLFGFEVALSLALGSMFFVIVQHFTSAGWSVTVRRTAEFFTVGIFAMVVLFAPVFMMRNTLFPWLHPAKAEHAEHAAEPKVGTTETNGALLQAGEPSGATAPAGAAGAQGGHTTPAGADPLHVGEPTGAAGEKHTDDGSGGGHGDGHGGGQGDGRGHGHGVGVGAPGTGHGGRGDHAEHTGAGAVAHHATKGDPEEIEAAEKLEAKSGYLNERDFSIRAVVYLIIWCFIAWKLFDYSVKQDTSKDPKLTVAVQRFAPVATPLFALSLTFAAFDWIMSLEPSWFSTIFGVYFFAGSVVSSYALLILVTMGLRNSGILQKEIHVEHFHDLGKLMFGFLVFWAYIGFAQFMLIWYAALPEETTFFHRRWDEGPWRWFSLALVFFHFVVPFFLVISRNTKRHLPTLRLGAAWILVMHVVDVYWLVMPNCGQAGFAVHWLDLTCLLGCVGAYFAVALYFMKGHSLIPVGDPRLPRALHFENA